MAFFVEVKNNSKAKSSSKKSTDFALEVLTIGKRVGMTFEEMNELRVRDLLEIARLYWGIEDENEKEATQDDIDSFYAR